MYNILSMNYIWGNSEIIWLWVLWNFRRNGWKTFFKSSKSKKNSCTVVCTLSSHLKLLLSFYWKNEAFVIKFFDSIQNFQSENFCVLNSLFYDPIRAKINEKGMFLIYFCVCFEWIFLNFPEHLRSIHIWISSYYENF